MTLLNTKSWLLLILILLCAVTGGVASLLQLWSLAAFSAFGLLLICAVLILLQTPRSLRVSRTIINRLQQLQNVQRQTNRASDPETSSLVQPVLKSCRKESTLIKQQLKETERRLLSVEENAAHTAEKDAQEIMILLRRIEKHLDNTSRSVSNRSASRRGQTD